MAEYIEHLQFPMDAGNVPAPSKKARLEDAARAGKGARIGVMSLFLTIAAVHLLALASPGPDFFFVSQIAISRSRREALAGVVGIALGVTVWAALALLGLQILLHRVAWLGRAMTLAGGAYLVWMGFQLLRSGFRRHPDLAPDAAVPAMALPGTPLTSLRRGFLTNIANPKAAVYFASIFSALVGDSVGPATRWGLAALVTIETLGWFTIVATIFGMPAFRRGYLRIQRWVDGLAGAVFIAFGLRLVLDRRAL